MSTYEIPTQPQHKPHTKKFELMPTGEHDLEVIQATDVDDEGAPLVTRAGDPRIKIKVMGEGGASFFHFLYLNEKAIPMVWEFLHACGVTCEGESFAFDPSSLVGKSFRADVYERDGWNRLRKPRPLPTESMQPTPDPEVPPLPPVAESDDEEAPF